MKVLAEVPEAQFSAARFGVSPDIRKDDFIYEYHLGPDQSRWETVRPGVVDYYCSDGARSAEQMDEPVAPFIRIMEAGVCLGLRLCVPASEEDE